MFRFVFQVQTTSAGSFPGGRVIEPFPFLVVSFSGQIKLEPHPG